MSNTPTSADQVAEGMNLLPCPFCGGAAELNKTPNMWIVECNNAGCGSNPDALAVLKHDVVAAWNRRIAATGADSPQPLPEGWEVRTEFRPGGYCETSDAMKNMQDEIKAWRAWAGQVCQLERELATFKGEHATLPSIVDDAEFQDLAGDIYRAGSYNESIEKPLNALIAYIDARTAGPAVPDGYVIVPVESTMEMDDAGHDSLLGRGANVEINDAEACWSAMIAAAPKPQEDA